MICEVDVDFIASVAPIAGHRFAIHDKGLVACGNSREQESPRLIGPGFGGGALQGDADPGEGQAIALEGLASEGSCPGRGL